MLVVAPDAAVARWAAEPIVFGPGAVMSVHVLGPERIPRVTDPADARARGALALLSGLAHGNEPRGEVAFAALVGLGTFDETVARMYLPVPYDVLDAATRRALEALVMESRVEPQLPPFVERLVERGEARGEARGKAEGRLLGKKEALLRLLARARLEPTDAHRARIDATADASDLDRWIERVLGAARAEDVFGA